MQSLFFLFTHSPVVCAMAVLVIRTRRRHLLRASIIELQSAGLIIFHLWSVCFFDCAS